MKKLFTSLMIVGSLFPQTTTNAIAASQPSQPPTMTIKVANVANAYAVAVSDYVYGEQKGQIDTVMFDDTLYIPVLEAAIADFPLFQTVTFYPAEDAKSLLNHKDITIGNVKAVTGINAHVEVDGNTTTPNLQGNDYAMSEGLLPVRYVFERAGYVVLWNEDSRSVSLVKKP